MATNLHVIPHVSEVLPEFHLQLGTNNNGSSFSPPGSQCGLHTCRLHHLQKARGLLSLLRPFAGTDHCTELGDVGYHLPGAGAKVQLIGWCSNVEQRGAPTESAESTTISCHIMPYIYHGLPGRFYLFLSVCNCTPPLILTLLALHNGMASNRAKACSHCAAL